MNPIVSAISRHAASAPGAPALSDGGEHGVTYRELVHGVIDAARAWVHEGAAPVALAADNGPAWAIADLTLLAAGRPSLPLPPFFSPAQQAHALRDAGARVLLTDRAEHYERLLKDHEIAAVRARDCTLGAFRLARFDLDLPQRPEVPADTIKVTYTSGTTGTPKGVCLGDSAIATVARSLALAAELSPPDRHVAILPLSTLLENIGGVYAPLSTGACAVLVPLAQLGLSGAADLALERLADVLRTQRATTAITVPELLKGLCAALERGAARPDTLRFLAVGGAPLSIELAQRAARAGLPVYEGYGLTECASVVAVNTREAHRARSVGRVLPHAQVKIAPDGEIHVRGATLLGYTDGTRFDREWYATGDLGHIDDGYLCIDGRRRDVFITSYGRNVAPDWVESELTAAESIAQAWVYGEGRPWNVAVITPRPDAEKHAIDAALDAANRRLPDYARVRRWIRSTEPFSPSNGQLTANGRLRRASLLERYRTSLDQIYGDTEDAVLR